MGITLLLRSASKAQLEALIAHPELIPYFLTGGEIGAAPRGRTFWQRLTGRRPEFPAPLSDLSQSMQIDLDKAWHGLHYLFTGTAGGETWPQGFLVGGGVALEDESEDVHAIWPAQLVECRDFVHSLTEHDLRAEYDPHEMDELDIYPDIWLREGDEALEYVLEYFQTLSAFLRDAVAENQGCVISIG